MNYWSLRGHTETAYGPRSSRTIYRAENRWTVSTGPRNGSADGVDFTLGARPIRTDLWNRNTPQGVKLEEAVVDETRRASFRGKQTGGRAYKQGR